MMISATCFDITAKITAATTTMTTVTTLVTAAVISNLNNLDDITVSSLFDKAATIAIICLLIGMMIVATLVGNSLVIMAVLLVRKLKTQPANYLFVSLAVADFCVGLLVMPIALIDLLTDRWILGEMVRAF